MTVFAAMAALLTAACVGYYVGRRTGPAPPARGRRARRTALGRLAISLIMLLAARRAASLLGFRVVAPLALLRGGVARLRTY
ncbi:hypothetical protein [Mycobacterium helveticum]|jgi:hypothetical protein|uniref:Uncharacterized protein n=1 Tax=Mycobacterium helveticum TaxID=2592811 RepID=A0A557XGE4_9MYCO|nr:hypothetical protein [Mycobacterium helveticum]TVS82952.1 hypothetical protein FPZ46_22265 [Mycobacterium helveticum]TVS84711.1 hypothetical protein FPZ47_21225 [Mycobacterium helveticum]